MLLVHSSIWGDKKEQKNGVKIIEQKRKEKEGTPGIWKPVNLL